MRKLILAVFILTTIITLGVLENFYINKTFDTCIEQLNIAREFLVEDDSERAKHYTSQVQTYWEYNSKIIEITSYTPTYALIDLGLVETLALIDNEPTLALSKLDYCLALIETTQHTLSLNIYHVLANKRIILNNIY